MGFTLEGTLITKICERMPPERLRPRTARGALPNSNFGPKSLFLGRSSCRHRAEMCAASSNLSEQSSKLSESRHLDKKFPPPSFLNLSPPVHIIGTRCTRVLTTSPAGPTSRVFSAFFSLNQERSMYEPSSFA